MQELQKRIRTGAPRSWTRSGSRRRSTAGSPRRSLREVADALDETPAYCHSIASFYDMYHLEPVGRHMVEVCTNLSCALAGAQAVLDAFAEELGVQPGGTTEDGEVTLRAIECAGGCGRAPVVVIDHVYHEPVTPEDVPELVGAAAWR